VKKKIHNDLNNALFNDRLSAMLELLSIILKEFASESRAASIINIDDDPLFSQGSSVNIFFDITMLLDKNELSDNIRATIYMFVTKCLDNKLISSKFSSDLSKEPSHENFVRNMWDKLNSLEGVFKKLEDATNAAHDPAQVILAIACCELIYYYTYNSCEIPDGDNQDHDMKLNAPEAYKPFKDKNREMYLFKAFEIPNDELRVIITKILNSIDVTELDFSHHPRLWNMIKEQKNVGAGTNEEVIGTIFLIMTKITQAFRENPSKFIQENSAHFVSGSLDMLRKNMSRDLREDIHEQDEKNILNVCIITFLKSLVAKGQTERLETTTNMDNILSILKDESNLNPLTSLSTDVEKTVGYQNIKGRRR
jgi:hypothetical protein